MIDIKELRRDASAAHVGHMPMELSGSEITELLDRLEAAEKERDNANAAAAGIALQAEKFEAERDELRAQRDAMLSTFEKFYDGIDWIQRALQAEAEIEVMKRQEPVAWAATDETGVVVEALGMNQSRRFDTALYLAPGAQLEQKAVAYLDIGAGGYMDIGTDLNDEQLASLPKGRHMLGIVGTYGVAGYVSAQRAARVSGVGLDPSQSERNDG